MSTLQNITLRLFDTDAFTFICLLPSPVNINMSVLASDTGSLTFEYPKQGINGANTLAEHRFIAVEIDGVEYDNCRFIIEDIQGSRTEDANYVITCRSLISLFEKAIVYPPNWNMQGQPGQPSPFVLQQVEAFGNASQGRIMRYLASKAQGRGALTAWGFSTFTNTLDSNGIAWNQLLNLTYDVGTNYYEILRSWVDGLLVDFNVGPDMAFRMYNWNEIGVDYTTGPSPVVLFRGRDISDSPYHSTGRDRASFILVHGEEALYSEASSPTAYNAVGRWEQYIDSGGVTDQGTLSVMAQQQLISSSKIKQEHNFNINPFSNGPQPFKDFKPLDWLFGDYGSGNVKLQIRQITIATDDKGTIQHSVITLNDLINDYDLTLEARMNSLSHGKGTATATTKKPSSKDKMPPAAPLGVALSSDAYVDSAKHTHAQLTIAWTAPVTNADGTPLTDLNHFNVSWQYFGGTWFALPIPGEDDVSTSVSPLDTNKSVRARVRAVDDSGNKGAWFTSTYITTGNDTTPPPVPSTPIVDAATLPGILRVRWDGKGVANATMPADFDHIEVHVSTTNNFTPGDSTRYDTLRTAGISDVSGKASVVLYIKFISVDSNDNKSAPSAQVSATPIAAVGTDIDTGALTINTVQFKDIGNLIPDGSFEDATNRNAVTPVLPAGWSFDNTAFSHGLWSLKASGAGTWDIAQNMVVYPGQQYWIRFAERGIAAAGTVSVGMVVTMQGGATQLISQVVSTTDLGWQTHANVLTMPANAMSAKFFITTTHNSGTRWIDSVEARLMVSTAIIQDAAITNAQIADLAVNDAKIGSMTAGKIVGGSFLFDIGIAARLATAFSGARVELSSSGLLAYDAAGNVTVNISATGGNAFFHGTLRTGTTGARIELLPVTALVGTTAAAFYSGHPTETNPGLIYTLATSSELTLTLTTPYRNGVGGSVLGLSSFQASLTAPSYVTIGGGAESLQVSGSGVSANRIHVGNTYISTEPAVIARALGQNAYSTAILYAIGGMASSSGSWDFARFTSNDDLGPDREFTFTGAGTGRCDGTWTGGGGDYAELFETVDGKNISPGTAVVLEGKMVRRAKKGDELFALISTMPSVLGNNPLIWPKKYIKDEQGFEKYARDHENAVHPDFDYDQEYIPRSDRPEWVPVALLGQVPALDDGTCEVGGYANIGIRGRLTAAEEGWKVLERIDEGRVLVLVR